MSALCIFHRLTRPGAIVVAMAVVVLSSASSVAAESLLLRVKPVATVSQRIVRLGDILVRPSDVSEELAGTDLLEIPASDSTATVERDVISIRLQLAGHARSEFDFSGPEVVAIIFRGTEPERSIDRSIVQVSATSESEAVDRDTSPVCSDKNIEQAIRKSLCEQFGLPENSISARLKRPFTNLRAQNDSGVVELRLEVLAPTEQPLGTTSFTIRCWDGDRLISTQAALADVRQQRRVLIAQRAISAGSSVSAELVSQELRFVDRPADELRPDDLDGLIARRSIRSREILSLTDFQKPTESESGQIVIKARDAVRVIARRKTLRFIVPAAEAMQSGRVGQLIRVRNLQSDRVITGRVVAAGEVEAILE